MISLPPSVQIFIGTTPIDMRKSIDGIMAIVYEELREDAYSGHLYVFVSRRCDRVKILAWDKGGFVLLYKRLDRGTFRVPEAEGGATSVAIEERALDDLLDGIDVEVTKRTKPALPH